MSNLFKPKLPEVKPPVPLPDTDDESVARARRRSLEQQRARRGRAATVLSGRRGGAGQEFSRTLLG
jgi:hypothetical protein